MQPACCLPLSCSHAGSAQSMSRATCRTPAPPPEGRTSQHTLMRRHATAVVLMSGARGGAGAQWSGHSTSTPLFTRGVQIWIGRGVLRGWRVGLGRGRTVVVECTDAGGHVVDRRQAAAAPQGQALFSEKKATGFRNQNVVRLSLRAYLPPHHPERLSPTSAAACTPKVAVGETVILLTPSLSMRVETPATGRGGCRRIEVSPTANRKTQSVCPCAPAHNRCGREQFSPPTGASFGMPPQICRVSLRGEGGMLVACTAAEKPC